MWIWDCKMPMESALTKLHAAAGPKMPMCPSVPGLNTSELHGALEVHCLPWLPLAQLCYLRGASRCASSLSGCPLVVEVSWEGRGGEGHPQTPLTPCDANLQAVPVEHVNWLSCDAKSSGNGSLYPHGAISLCLLISMAQLICRKHCADCCCVSCISQAGVLNTSGASQHCSATLQQAYRTKYVWCCEKYAQRTRSPKRALHHEC